MESASLKGRAITFALCAGAVVFILAVLATSHGSISLDNLARALIPALVCAVFSWAAAERAIGTTASALDAAIGRIVEAASGDLDSPIPDEIDHVVPHLSSAMGTLFQQVAANLDSVQRLAMYDPVTSLPNRTHFRRAAERQLAEMPEGDVAALLFIDLDRFKAVNDTMGHACGDILLGMVANRLRAVADSVAASNGTAKPLIGRLAGDEFTMLFPKLRDANEAARIGRGVLYALTEPFDLAGTEVEVGASIGIAMRPAHGTTLHDLMGAADAAMYHAKANGRGRAEHFSDALATQLADRAKLEVDLRSAIERGQFALVYQPQVSLRDGRIVAAEALLRWRHPSDGIKLPASFLQCAEDTGLIVEIGDWVIGEVAATIRRWADAGIEQRLAINISQRQLDHALFFRRLRDAMLAANAPARLLELEITETLAMHCSADVIEAIAALRADGATIAIDDYGTGHSNVSRLRQLPIDRVKLDRSLIEHITTDAEARQIAQSVVGLIHGLGCESVAEGIELADQVDMLKVIGCDVAQGYAVAAPMDEDAFVGWSRGDQGERAAG
ncbi:MAG: EAL domain-containing protein [Sphingomonas sp.]|uniref:putative bifunctional diguanylate cyclase/phosphodiesterase n=1 Tax=Sphingomonas sp. TaxID=28214 RepID=UPI001226583C|nr:EAL domain-containing protein [Sphingomonas sp.]THD35427.1 MAG: EAL domain-containing protein [Sphingomonas sp.]